MRPPGGWRRWYRPVGSSAPPVDEVQDVLVADGRVRDSDQPAVAPLAASRASPRCEVEAVTVLRDVDDRAGDEAEPFPQQLWHQNSPHLVHLGFHRDYVTSSLPSQSQ